MSDNQQLLTKNLRYLFYAALAGLVISLLDKLPISTDVFTWLARVVTVCTIVILFRLGPANGRYQWAAIFRIIPLAITLVNTFVLSPLIMQGVEFSFGWLLTLVSSVASILGTYQLYWANGEVSRRDGKLTAIWHKLFIWGTAVALFFSLGSWVLVKLTMRFIPDSSAFISGVFVTLYSWSNIVFSALYTVFLYKTLRLAETEEDPESQAAADE